MEQPEKGSIFDLVQYRIETAKADLQSIMQYQLYTP